MNLSRISILLLLCGCVTQATFDKTIMLVRIESGTQTQAKIILDSVITIVPDMSIGTEEEKLQKRFDIYDIIVDMLNNGETEKSIIKFFTDLKEKK